MKRIKEISIGIGVILFYLLSSIIFTIIISLLHIDYNHLNNNIKITINLLYDIFMIVIIVWIYHKTFKEHFNKFKKNIIEYISTYLKYWFLAIILMIISNMLISLTGATMSSNEQAILKLFHKYPIYVIITAVAIAPILEETVFRLAIRKIISNNYLYIILSGLLFGLLHVSSSSNPSQLLYIIPYSIPGCIFAYTLVKSDNIFVPISLHCIHNTILMIGQIILLFI